MRWWVLILCIHFLVRSCMLRSIVSLCLLYPYFYKLYRLCCGVEYYCIPLVCIPICYKNCIVCVVVSVCCIPLSCLFSIPVFYKPYPMWDRISGSPDALLYSSVHVTSVFCPVRKAGS